MESRHGRFLFEEITWADGLTAMIAALCRHADASCQRQHLGANVARMIEDGRQAMERERLAKEQQ